MAAGDRNVTAYSQQSKSAGNPYVLVQDLNFNDVVTVKGGAIEANEVAQVMSIKAGTLVQAVTLEVITPAVGTTFSVCIGDGDNANGYYKNGTTYADCKAAAGTLYGPVNTLTEGGPNVADPPYFGGKLYTAADTIDVKVMGYSTITTLPKVRLTAVCIDVNH